MVQQVDDPIGSASTPGRPVGPVSGRRDVTGVGLEGRESTLFRPVVSGSLGGLDSLLSTVQMPPGMPVATVAIGGAENAGLLAAQMIGIADAEVAKRVEAERASRRKKVLDSDAEVRGAKG